MGRMDDMVAKARQRRAFLALTPEQRQSAMLKVLGKRDDLPVEALEHVAYLAESYNADGVPDLDKVPEAYRDRLESTLKRRGWHYLGGNTQGSSG